jgi:hypothetical protein
VPSVAGGGIQLKTIEGISLGIPVISTRLGVRGISALPPYVHVVNGAPEMASKIVHVLAHGKGHDHTVGQKWAQERILKFNQKVSSVMERVKMLQ